MLLLKQDKKKWQNWAKNETCFSHYVKAKSVEDIQKAVNNARELSLKIRPVGSSHSFSKLIPNDGIILDTSALSGVIEVDRSKKLAHVYSGTILGELNKELFLHGLALPNLGDVDVQSIAGAIATGTHGTGAELGIISNQVVEVTFVNGLGEVKTVTESSDENLLRALKVNLGAFGVVISLKLQLVDAFKLKLKTSKMEIDDIIKDFDKLSNKYRHFEFFWFPYTKYAQVKKMEITQAEIINNKALDFINDFVLENMVYGFLIKLCVWTRFFTKFFSEVVTSFIGENEKINWSHLIFATPRINRFREMEIALDRSLIKPAIKIIEKIIKKHQLMAIIPVEVRTVKKDDLLISPAYGRESVYIAIHAPLGTLYKECFNEIHQELEALGGRPHWGKVNNLDQRRLLEVYPKADEFIKLRQMEDPGRIFLNSYLENIF